MSLNQKDVEKITHLARLTLSEEEIAYYTPQLSNILTFVEQMNEINTSEVEPLTHPLDLSQRLRQDAVTEENKRELYQSIAPQVEAGLYLVPKVIESE